MKIIDTKRPTAVLENLFDAETGTRVVKEILAPIFKNPQINTLYVVGQPTSGKTTIIGQYLEALEDIAQKVNIPLEIKTVFFDKAQAKAEEKIRSKFKNKPNSKAWDKKDWQVLEKILHSSISKPHLIKKIGKETKNRKKKIVTTIETPYILYWEKENYGRKIFERLTKKLKKAFFIYVVSDLKTMDKTNKMRSAIAGLSKKSRQLPSKNLVKIIERDYNTLLIGFDNSKKSGDEIKKIVNRMAPREAVLKVKEKTEEMINDWQKDIIRGAKYLDLVILPPQYQSLPKEEQWLYKRDAAYMLYVLREELALPTYRAKVVYNPNLPNDNIFLYLKLLS